MVLNLVAHRRAFELPHRRSEEKEHVDQEGKPDADHALLDHCRDRVEDGPKVELLRHLFKHIIQVDAKRLITPSRCRIKKLKMNANRRTYLLCMLNVDLIVPANK